MSGDEAKLRELFETGNALLMRGDFAAALDAYDQGARIYAAVPVLQFNRGLALAGLGRFEDAMGAYQEAVRLQPDYAEALNNLGNLYKGRGDYAQAGECFQRAIQSKPHFALAYSNLGVVLALVGKLEEAKACYRKALELEPGYAEAFCNLGMAASAQGQTAEALACYRKAMALKPGYVEAHSNLLQTLYMDPATDAATLKVEHERWNRQHAAGLRPVAKHFGNSRDPHRRLRVGYVSADMRQHAVGRFLRPLLAAHDHAQFEIFAYATLAAPDAVTAALKQHVDRWQNILGMTDAAAAALMERDGIDILVDLSMHMAGNRLLAFARQPAPVQVTYLAYAGTTGMEAVQYRLSDPYLDSPAETTHYTEETVRLPETYWCYAPQAEAPEVNALPAATAGHVTLGCLCNFNRVNDGVLAAWGRIMQRLPGSRILVHALEGGHRQRMVEALGKMGIGAERVAFVGYKSLPGYFGMYHQIDVALDCFPYAGGTTTCDALWMGVPVVTLTGKLATGRGGVSILSNVGLPELIGEHVEAYVEKAVALGMDGARLAELRRTLRGRMRGSPLMDAPRFVGNLEAAYRGMWGRWCSDGSQG